MVAAVFHIAAYSTDVFINKIIFKKSKMNGKHGLNLKLWP